MKNIILSLSVLAFIPAFATIVDITGVGAEKISVTVDISNPAYSKCLKKNLELSGAFKVVNDGSIKVSGTPGASVTAIGRGKSLTSVDPVSDEKSARMAARKLADQMCEAFANQKGFALDRIAFVSRKSSTVSELCAAYPDGWDIRQLTGKGKQVVGPRWKDKNTLFYTGIVNAGPQIWEFDTAANSYKMKWSFKGLATGATVSPDGKKAAIILSFQGNPELYIIDLATGRWTRMTNTPNASEGQPAWSPDGSKIVYVSDETRHPQLYILDVATKKTRRLTSKGSQNVDPDWGKDGRITYITKRGGLSQVAVLNPAEGESSAQLVTTPGSWEHPSWARDSRHVVAGRDKALFIVDTLEGGDAPSMMPLPAGNWITPAWSK
ncbi:MAG: DPP IV N-terminal domain-containing protein [Kiritimatiellae bacterium]|nr:DPP IV N-terminal domain-containing protein [Kiritimatiellia bacterium]